VRAGRVQAKEQNRPTEVSKSGLKRKGEMKGQESTGGSSEDLETGVLILPVVTEHVRFSRAGKTSGKRHAWIMNKTKTEVIMNGERNSGRIAL